MTMERRPSMQSTRIYLLGYLMWTLGVGSALHPLLYDPGNSHYCSYGLTGRPTSMWVVGALGLVAFPLLLAITRGILGPSSGLSHSALALRIGAAHLVLVVVGTVLAILVGTRTVSDHDSLELAPLILTPILFVVLSMSRTGSDGMRRSLLRIAPGAAFLIIMPLIIVGWRIDIVGGGGSNLFYDDDGHLFRTDWFRDGSLVLYFIWMVTLLFGVGTGVISRLVKSGNEVAGQISLMGTSMLLVTVPTALMLVSWLIAHALYCGG